MRNNVSLENAFKGFFRDTYLIFSVGKKRILAILGIRRVGCSFLALSLFPLLVFGLGHMVRYVPFSKSQIKPKYWSRLVNLFFHKY